MPRPADFDLRFCLCGHGDAFAKPCVPGCSDVSSRLHSGGPRDGDPKPLPNGSSFTRYGRSWFGLRHTAPKYQQARCIPFNLRHEWYRGSVASTRLSPSRHVDSVSWNSEIRFPFASLRSGISRARLATAQLFMVGIVSLCGKCAPSWQLPSAANLLLCRIFCAASRCCVFGLASTRPGRGHSGSFAAAT